MSNFWASKVTPVYAPPAPAPLPRGAVQQWWMPQGMAQNGPDNRQQPLGVDAEYATAYARQAAKAQSSRLKDTCPECASGNWFHPQGTGANFSRCFDCGYNPNFMQQGGMGGGKSDGPTQQSRQVVGAGGGHVSNNFHPDIIVGTVEL